MGSNPLVKSTLTGVVLQAVMVLVGKYVPAIGGIPNIYAILGTVLAAITGAIATRNAPGVATGAAATNGAIAGGASSVLGGLLAVGTGQWPGFAAVQMLGPLLSGAVAGGVGGALQKMLLGKRAA